MTGLQIAVLLIGVLLVVLSFFMTKKFSEGDIEEIRKMSKAEVKTLLDQELKDADHIIQQTIDARLEDGLNRVERETDRETNEKILQISEYSDSVLTSMNKSHDEIIFMYDMLNDKQENVTKLSTELHNIESEIRSLKVALEKKTEELKRLQVTIEKEQKELDDQRNSINSSEVMSGIESAGGNAFESESSDEKTEIASEKGAVTSALEKYVRKEEDGKKSDNETILALHEEGLSEVEIAKKLGRGIGEVKLVLGLFKGGKD